MENKIKLYKCYKATCNKCLNEENPYITEDEYNELLDADGKIRCPEGHTECGIQELTPEDYANLNPPKDKKKYILIGGGLLVLVLIIGTAIFFTSKSKIEPPVVPDSEIVKPKPPQGGQHKPDSVVTPPTDPKAETIIKLINQADLLFASKEYSRAKDLYNSILAIDSNNRNAIQKLQEIAKITGPPEGPHGPVIVEHATVKYDYGYYEGPTKDGLAHGTNGIMYFQQRHIINPRDPEKRYAEAGEYVSGIFHDGFLVNGKYFGKDRQQKGAINIGR